MPAIILPRKWSRQPLGSLSINYANPLSIKLTFAWTPSTELGNDAAFNNTLPTQSVTGSFGANKHGRHYVSGAGTSAGLSFGSSRLTKVITSGNNNYTILSIAAPVSSATRYAFFTNGNDGASPYAQQAFLANAADGGTVAGKIELNEYDGARKLIVWSTNAYVDGSQHVFAAVRTGSLSARLFVDGMSVGTSSGGQDGSTANVTSGATQVSGSSGSPRAMPYPNTLVLVWDKALSDSEIFVISANPWQIFKRDPQRLYFDVSTGGITGSGTLTTPAVTLAGTGTVAHKGTGALTTPVTTLAGAGKLGHIGTGALTGPVTTLTGVGKLVHIGTGELTVPVVTLNGDGTIPTPGLQTGTGTLTTPVVTLSGAGKVTHTGTGDLSTAAVTLAGAGKLGHTGTGDLTTPAATLYGTDSTAQYGSGLLLLPAVTLSGSGIVSSRWVKSASVNNSWAIRSPTTSSWS